MFKVCVICVYVGLCCAMSLVVFGKKRNEKWNPKCCVDEVMKCWMVGAVYCGVYDV